MDRFSQFVMVAAAEAVRGSGLDFSKEDPFRCGVIMGSGIGGLNTFEEGHSDYMQGGPRRINLLVIPKMIANAAPGNISIHYGLMGPNTSVATACASAGNAIGDALRTIRTDDADIIITGGTEAAITPTGLGGFCSLRALSQRNDAPTKASRPFDRDRDGFVLSEGAGVLILEEYEHAKKRGAPIYAELLGAAATADAYHITAPHPEGKGAIAAMQRAIRDARIAADEVDYINAHGTSTDLGDIAETNAIKQAFGAHARKVSISSTKSMTGHLLGASGGIELIACILSIRDGIVHPTINLDNPDPQCDLDYVPNFARERKVRYAISNSFGFGGHNACVVVGAV
jgi:3-oxoacyl-[acyl-carrier-protein] synthase II